MGLINSGAAVVVVIIGDEKMEEEEGRGGGRERGGGWECGGVGGAAGGVAAAEMKLEMCELLCCVNLKLKIWVLMELRSDCKVWSWCWRAEMTPMQPYTGSLSLRFAS